MALCQQATPRRFCRRTFAAVIRRADDEVPAAPQPRSDYAAGAACLRAAVHAFVADHAELPLRRAYACRALFLLMRVDSFADAPRRRRH